jgi:hypothetical protein
MTRAPSTSHTIEIPFNSMQKVMLGGTHYRKKLKPITKTMVSFPLFFAAPSINGLVTSSIKTRKLMIERLLNVQ